MTQTGENVNNFYHLFDQKGSIAVYRGNFKPDFSELTKKLQKLSILLLWLQENEHIVDYVIDSMIYVVASYHSWIESHPIIDPVTPDLLDSESFLLSKYMTNIREDDVIALRNILDLHPLSTEMNVTSLHRTSEMRFTHVPLVVPLMKTPVANLPVEKIGDFGVPLRYSGLLYEDRICRLDSNMTMETTDGVLFHIPKNASDCKRVLARDCTEENTFELSFRSGHKLKNQVSSYDFHNPFVFH